MLIFLGSGIRLLLPFLSTTTKSQHKMKSGLLLRKQHETGFKNYYMNAHGFTISIMLLLIGCSGKYATPQMRGVLEEKKEASDS